MSYEVLHALHGARVIRALRAMVEAAPARTTDAGSQSWVRKTLNFLETLNGEVHEARRGGADRLEPDALAARVASFGKVLTLSHEHNADPPGGWSVAARRPKAVNLLLRSKRQQEANLHFMVGFAMPFKNKQAERDLWRGAATEESFFRVPAHPRRGGGLRGDPVLLADREASGPRRPGYTTRAVRWSFLDPSDHHRLKSYTRQ